MKHLNIAVSNAARPYVPVQNRRTVVDASKTDFVNVSALIVMDDERDLIDQCNATGFGIPIFIMTSHALSVSPTMMKSVYHIVDVTDTDSEELYERELDHAATEYEDSVLPPFFKAVVDYSQRGNLQFDTPGHQGGLYFRKTPAGRQYFDFFGQNLFRADTSSSDIDLGDLLINEGPALEALRHASKVFNADKTYFVLGGTTMSNNIVINAAVTPGDLVLFDRNNHKSVYNQALVKSGGRPVYLQTSRDPYGFIGGIYDQDLNEDVLRAEAAKIDPVKAQEKRPFRLAIIQLGTYDGTIYNARQIIQRIGHLCDYILFDSAGVGYEQFIPMMSNSSPLLIDDLGPDDPGIFVTQSTHKQQAGLELSSQILKKDHHIKGQKRYINHKHMNNSYMQYASTSPLYALYAGLDVNAKMQEGKAGQRLWHDCLVTGINARKKLLTSATYVRPFVPPTVHGQPWETADTETIASDIAYWSFDPEDTWHGFKGYAKDQYYVDPNKFLLSTVGIDTQTGEYEDFGVPAVILSHYLREHGIVAEKNDLNSILFLMTPSETDGKMDNLIAQLLDFEELIDEDAPVEEVLPHVYKAHQDRYDGYTIRQLCQEMHDFYKEHDTNRVQERLFLREYFPERAMTAYEANIQFCRNNCKLVPLADIKGEVALEGALPYPPGIFCVVPGERWTATARDYFMILLEGINRFPGFAPEIQGVYFTEENGHTNAYGYVYDPETTREDD